MLCNNDSEIYLGFDLNVSNGTSNKDIFKIYGVIDFGKEIITTPKYNLIESYGLSGYTRQSENAYKAVEREVIIYVKNKTVINEIELDREQNIYFNNENYFYKGIIDEISFEKLFQENYLLKIKLILQNFKYSQQYEQTFNESGTIENKGQKIYPILEITPQDKNFSVSISNQKMTFKIPPEDNKRKIIVDCEKSEIVDNQGNLKNSYLLSNDFIDLKKGVNSVILDRVSELIIKVNWGYLV